MDVTSGGLIYLIITIIAIYLAFQRNGGFEIISFLVALFLPFVYIIYYFLTQITGTSL